MLTFELLQGWFCLAIEKFSGVATNPAGARFDVDSSHNYSKYK
jgi:hypothetical protein